jgi:hypothetical protein
MNEEQSLVVGAASKRPLTQRDCDEFLFVQMAQNGSVDMAESRDDGVVQNMIRMRDEGDHPSVISATDKMTSSRRQTLRPLPEMDEHSDEDGDRRERRPREPRVTEFDSVSNVHKPKHVSDRRSTHSARSYDSKESRERRRERQEMEELELYNQRERERERKREKERELERNKRGDRDSRHDDRRSRARSSSSERGRSRRDKPSRRQDDRNNRSRYSDASARRSETKGRGSEARSATSGYGDGADIAARFKRNNGGESAPSPFMKVVQQQLAELTEPPKPLPTPIPIPKPVSVISERSRASIRHRPRAGSPESAIESSVSHPSRRQFKGASYKERLEADERETRHEIILELDKYEIPFEGDEPTWQLRHKLERVLANRQTVAKVKFIRMGIQLGSTIVELIIVKIFPRLKLKGWAEGLAKDLSTGNYDGMLEQVYRKVWRKGGMPNVWLMLAMLVLGSAVLHCIGFKGSAEEGAGGPVTAFNGGLGGMMGMLGSVFAGLGGGSTSTKPAPTKVTATSTSSPNAPSVERKRPRIAPIV